MNESKKRFISEIKKELEVFLPDYKIEEVDIVKSNDRHNAGFTFLASDLKAAPTLYVDEAYERHLAGEDIKKLALELVNAVISSMHIAEILDQQSDCTFNTSFDNIKDKLELRLLDEDKNRDYLADKVYREVGNGMVLLLAIQGKGSDSEFSAVITNALAEQEGYDIDALFKAAEGNTTPVLREMTAMLFDPNGKSNLLDEEAVEADEGMFVLSTRTSFMGAAAFFVTGLAEKLKSLFKGGYYVLPSSVHEMIILPEEVAPNVWELKRMVREANRSVVEEADILSDKVFHYGCDGGLTLV